MSGLTVTGIQKSYEGKSVLAGVGFHQDLGELLAVLGPSGCGKSTLLSIIAGLTSPDGGRVVWDQQDLSGIPSHKRGFGLMFQDYALFPHMNVSGNIAFGLRMQGVSREVMDQTIAETLDLVGLPGFASRNVHNLSGGEQQRIALARALAPQPKLLMLDEPLGSLDRALREQLLEDLRRIIRQTKQTTLYVTHDQEEAYALADRIVVMRAGEVVQIGTPQQIYQQPNSAFVARFVGLSNLVPGEAQGEQVSTALGSFPLKAPAHGPVQVLLRPDAARMGDDGSELTGKVIELIFRGESSLVRIEIEHEGHDLSFELPSDDRLPMAGDQVHFSIEPGSGLQWFPMEQDELT
jgi:ABC-type Fe3+/spermidine/putrescine transport system ATPase subunit